MSAALITLAFVGVAMTTWLLVVWLLLRQQSPGQLEELQATLKRIEQSIERARQQHEDHARRVTR
jgi:hypothetical protein